MARKGSVSMLFKVVSAFRRQSGLCKESCFESQCGQRDLQGVEEVAAYTLVGHRHPARLVHLCVVHHTEILFVIIHTLPYFWYTPYSGVQLETGSGPIESEDYPNSEFYELVCTCAPKYAKRQELPIFVQSEFTR